MKLTTTATEPGVSHVKENHVRGIAYLSERRKELSKNEQVSSSSDVEDDDIPDQTYHHRARAHHDG